MLAPNAGMLKDKARWHSLCSRVFVPPTSAYCGSYGAYVTLLLNSSIIREVNLSFDNCSVPKDNFVHCLGGILPVLFSSTIRMTVLTTLGGAIAHSPLYITLAPFFLLSIYVSLVIIYRLTLHPLAKYPGPFLAKVTDIYLAYHAWKGDRHLEFYRCHEKYGKFIILLL
jgi:hypothetical protein